MKYKILPLLLFLLQTALVLISSDELTALLHADVWMPGRGKAYLLFAVSIAIPVLYLYFLLNKDKLEAREASALSKLIGFGLGSLSILITFWLVRKLFWDFPEPSKFSDVVPQIEALYDRFASGVFPYSPVLEFSWQPYPVYMPLHWLPLAIPRTLHIDVRWIGVFLLVAAAGYYGMYIWRRQSDIASKVLAILLPFFALQGYLQWGRMDIAVSYEIIIAAYYLLLAAGLASHSLPVTIAGIICCLLSRYTMVFWVPTFAILLWLNAPKRASFWAWGIVLAAFLLIYFLPFYAQDPTILKDGVAYHNKAAIAEWVGYGEPPVSYSFLSGVSFAEQLKAAFSGDMEHRVFLARIVQASVMLGTMAIALLLYRRWKDRINFYDFSLAFLYLFVLLFFMFGPLTYKYYYFALLMVSATICAHMLASGRRKKLAE